jgi:ribosomal protein S18 acetylase RimI-like enzyme
VEIGPVNLTNPSECLEAWTIQRAAYEVEASLIGSRGMQALHERVDDLAANISESFDGCWIVDGNHRVLVAVVAVEREERGWLISRLAVDPRWARRGIGRALVEHVLRRYGQTFLAVSTGAANLPARALYESVGFSLRTTSIAPDGTPLVRYERAP